MKGIVMLRNIFIFLVVSSIGTAFAENKDIFKLTPDDEGRISKVFITNIRAGVGDKNASHASTELYKFVINKISASSASEREDYEISYINYLERLYQRAFNAALAKLPADKQTEILKREKDWQQKVVNSTVYKIRCPYSGISSFSTASQSRHIRLYHNRAQYWECSPERRAEIDRFQGLQIRSICGDVPVEYNELRRRTPLKLHGEPISPKEKNYIEDIATLPLDFCREVEIGSDVYQIAVVIPNNDVSGERSTQGYERIVVIWKNRQYHALYYLPHHADIWELKIKGSQLSVKYFQIDEFGKRDKRKKNPQQTFTVDFTYEIYAPVKITNWLDYYTDGLGNFHHSDCCKDKF